jgi:hypothetical protein
MKTIVEVMTNVILLFFATMKVTTTKKLKNQKWPLNSYEFELLITGANSAQLN